MEDNFDNITDLLMFLVLITEYMKQIEQNKLISIYLG